MQWVHWCGLQFVWVRCLSEQEHSGDIGGVRAGQGASEGLGRAQKYVIFIARGGNMSYSMALEFIAGSPCVTKQALPYFSFIFLTKTI
jgi:hypothetical protein